MASLSRRLRRRNGAILRGVRIILGFAVGGGLIVATDMKGAEDSALPGGPSVATSDPIPITTGHSVTTGHQAKHFLEGN